jgi:hypothetical protein
VEVLPEDDITEVNPVSTTPVAVVPVPVSVTPVAAAPTAPPASQPAGAVSPLGGLFQKAGAAVAPTRPQPSTPTPATAGPVQYAPVQVLPVEVVKDDISARDTGDFEPDQFARCRESLREAGILPEDLVFFCNTRNRQQIGNPGVFNIVGSPQPKAVLHLALTKREVALVHEGEGKKIAIERAPHEAISWKFTAAEDANKPPALGIPATPLKREQVPPERIEVLLLGLPSGDHEVRLTSGVGLTTLKKRAAQLFQDLARAHLAGGKYYYADKLVRQIEPALVPAAEVEALRQQIGAVAEAVAHYRGGHPQFLDGARGVLRLDALGLEFAPPGEARQYMRIRYDHIVDIMEPQKGDFPEEMVKGAEAKKSVARPVGVVSGVGKAVAGDLKDSAALGPPPKNRLCAVLLLDGIEHRVSFDVAAGTKEEMEQQARGFWNRTAAVRARFARPGPAPAKAVAAPAAGAPGHLAALRELKELLDRGVLTQEEFAQQKAALLGSTRGANVQPRVVGCPRCQSKLRAKKPGVILCPKCQAKVRVAESLF